MYLAALREHTRLVIPLSDIGVLLFLRVNLSLLLDNKQEKVLVSLNKVLFFKLISLSSVLILLFCIT